MTATKRVAGTASAPLSPSQQLKLDAILAYSKDGKTASCRTCGEAALVCLTLSHVGEFTEAEKAEAARIGRRRLGGVTLRGWLKRQGWPKDPNDPTAVDPNVAHVVIECMNCNLKRRGWGSGGWEEGGRRRMR